MTVDSKPRAAAQVRLVDAGSEFLRRFPPFDSMALADVRFLAERLSLAYFEKGRTLLTPDYGVPQHYFLLQRGQIASLPVNEGSLGEETVVFYGPGEGFPVSALSAQRATTRIYRAEQDSFCYLLPVADFLALQQRSAIFQQYCSRHIASLLDQSRRQLQARFSQRASEQQSLTAPLQSLIKRPAVVTAPDTPLRVALQTMADAGVGSIVVIDAEGKAVGILTHSDVLHRVVLQDVPLTAPISRVMSPSPRAQPASSSAYAAMMAMVAEGIRHVLIHDGAGKVIGVVSERDLFGLQRVGLRQLRGQIENATDVPSLVQAAGNVRQLSLNLLAQGLGAEQMTQFISVMNDAITRRLLLLNLPLLERAGLPAEVRWSWLAFGSEGRHEQTFSTDQDNGIIFACAEDKVERYRQYFLAYAQQVNADLDACGFPLCKGGIMASNPAWCLSNAEWITRFHDWVRVPEPVALLNATIFFDFRSLADFGSGSANSLASHLRTFLLSITADAPAFLRALAVNALDISPPLGVIRDFATEDDGTLDLKTRGARLFVDVARILALRHGVEATNTAQRLRGCCEKAGPGKELHEAMSTAVEAFHFIQMLRMRHQYLDEGSAGTAGRVDGNKLQPESLNELDRRILKESLRQARKLQLRIKLDFQV